MNMAFCDSDGGREFTHAVLDVLGLKDAPVMSFDFRVAMDEPLTVRVEMQVDNDQAADLAKIIKRYEFASAERKPPTPESAAASRRQLDEAQRMTRALDRMARANDRPDFLDSEGNVLAPPTPDGWRDRPPMF